MPRPLKTSYKIEDEETQDKELKSKDLTKKGLFFYLFDDFFRGFYLIGCLFLDGIIIPGLRFLLPGGGVDLPFKLPSSITGLYIAYITILAIFLEFMAIHYEIIGFRRLWRKGTLGTLEKAH